MENFATAWKRLPFVIALGAMAGCGLPGGTSPKQEHLPTIAGFDTFADDDTVRVTWNAGNLPQSDDDGRPPAPDVVKIVLSISEDPQGGFVPYLEQTTTGVDTAYVTGLTSGKSYFFRLQTFAKMGLPIDQSRTLETQVAPVRTDLSKFGDVDLDGGRYHPPLAWTADGNSILFIETENYDDSRLVSHDLRTGEDRALTASPGEQLFAPACAPDAEQVAFCRSTRHNIPYEVCVLDLSSGVVRSITDGPVDSDPAWATGGKLYFCRGTSGEPNVPQIHSIETNDSTSVAGVLINDQYKYGLNLSPQEDRIAYSAYSRGSGDIAHKNLYAVTLSTGHVTRLLPESSSDNIAPAWSADGANIFFASDRSGHYEAWSLDVASGRLTRRGGGLPPGTECWAARPSPDGSRLALFEADRFGWKGWVRVVPVP